MSLDFAQTSGILVADVLWSEDYGMWLSNCYILKKGSRECAYVTISKCESKKKEKEKVI